MAHGERRRRDQLVRRRSRSPARSLSSVAGRERDVVFVTKRRASPAVAQALDRLARARERLVLDVEDPVEIEQDGFRMQGNCDRRSSRAWLRGFPGWPNAGRRLRSGGGGRSHRRPPRRAPAAGPPRRRPPPPTGWRVDPGPSGRGKPTVDPAVPRFPVLESALDPVLVVALALNIWLVSFLPDPPQRRVRIPYNPTFLAAGTRRQREVDLVQGRDRPGASCAGSCAIRPGDKNADPVALIDTEVPTFANEDELAACCSATA